MPELPEVETIRKVLLPIVKGNSINSIDILRMKTIEGDDKKFKEELTHETFLDVTRIGKYLIFHLTHNKVIISHLSMEGKYYEFLESEEDSKYAKVVFHLSNGKKLCYDDSRCFGILKLSSENEYPKEEMIAKLGPEPFVVKDVSSLRKAVKNSKKPIKTTLLDQTLMTGLGNIYVDETLYASHIHPLTPANKVTLEEWKKIVDNAVKILNIAIEMGGSTIKSYHPGKDIDGNFQTRIKIYGKAGEICPTCGHEFRFIKVGGRGTTFCPICQRKKGAPINIGITGKIASGKSTVLSMFKELGCSVISSDEIVASLYEKEEVAALLEKTLQIKFSTKTVNKDELRDHLLVNPKDKKKVERVIHPLVEREIVNFLDKESNPIRVVEVPLLFPAKLDHYFDTIAIIDVSRETQIKRLKERDPKNGELLLGLNKNNLIDENKNKATYLINNDKDLKSLKTQIKKIVSEVKDLIK